MLLSELLDTTEFEKALSAGRIRQSAHPIYPNIRIYEYTNSTIYDRSWDDITRKARGLIVNTDTMEVLARPFDKFFNHNEPDAPEFTADTEVVVLDKLDGSMGILFQRPDGFWEIATKGSFQSEQASHATIKLRQYGDFLRNLNPRLTYMFEIIYPKNRIVLDYGDMDALVLIGARRIDTGTVLHPNELPEWDGPKAREFSYYTLREALEAPPRTNAEGYVVHNIHTEEIIKIKQTDYLKLHKVVTGLTKKRIWESLSSGITERTLFLTIPEEWHDWLTAVVRELRMSFSTISVIAQSDYRQLVKQLNKAYPEGWDRKIFASHATNKDWTEYPFLLFMILDGVDTSPAIWKMIMPRGDE